MASVDATFWTAFGALATAAGAIGAVWTLLEIRKDSRDRTRPMMTAELKAAVLTKDAELHISNRGQSVAKNVHVIFDRPLPVLSGKDAEQLVTPFLQRRYAAPIPTITPGMVLDNLYTSATDRREPVPDDFTVRFEYEDSRGREYRDDGYHLSVMTLDDQTGSYPSSTDEAGLRRRLTSALEAIARGVGRH